MRREAKAPVIYTREVQPLATNWLAQRDYAPSIGQLVAVEPKTTVKDANVEVGR
jgi:hypothetical protein